MSIPCCSLGLNVPPGFIITTESSLEYFQPNGTKMPEGLVDAYTKAVHDLERRSGRPFVGGDGKSFPLLLSVRSGSPVYIAG